MNEDRHAEHEAALAGPPEERALREERDARVAAEQRADRLARLQRVTAAFSEALTPYDVATVALVQGVAAVGAQRGLVGVLAEDGGALEPLRHVGFSVAVGAALEAIPRERLAPLLDAARGGKACFFETPAAAAARHPALASLAGAGAGAVVPLHVEGRHLGALAFLFDAPRALDADERALVVTLARHAAHALSRARFYEALARARADAEDATRAKDDFLSNVSHELRTPLTAILGWANMLRTRPLDPAAAGRALAIIERNARIQSQLVADLLDVSRMAAGKLLLDLRAVEPASVLRAALDGVRPTAEAQGQRLEVEIDNDAGVIAADPDRLHQIALNLLSNAVKFTPRGGRIEVRLDRRDGHLALRVTDTGRGIAPAFLPHVFERFRQAEVGNARLHGGLGLGLSIVKHLVELHDGTITAHSEGEGQGASFTVTLPILLRPELEPADPLAGDRATPAPQRLDGLRVVVVDDNADARDFVATILQQQGAITTAVESAAEALRAIAEAQPDVLVSDIGMPEEDGYALLRRVRAVTSIPALALTAYAGSEDVKMAELAGFDRYLAKPVAPAKLVEAVARLAGRGG
jgi:hypothetical protein